MSVRSVGIGITVDGNADLDIRGCYDGMMRNNSINVPFLFSMFDSNKPFTRAHTHTHTHTHILNPDAAAVCRQCAACQFN